MNEENPIREEAAFRVLADASDGPCVIEVTPDVLIALHNNLDVVAGPISKRALLDALRLARALDSGYASAESMLSFLTTRCYSAIIESASKLVNEGDRARGAALAMRGVSIHSLLGAVEERKDVGSKPPVRGLTISYPGRIIDLEMSASDWREAQSNKAKVSEAVMRRKELIAGDMIEVEGATGRVILMRVANVLASERIRLPSKRKPPLTRPVRKRK
jgi:hypothetical protein